MPDLHSINWTTVLVALASGLLGGSGLLALVWKSIYAHAQSRLNIREKERHDTYLATENANVWLRKHVDELSAQLVQQDEQNEARFAALEARYEKRFAELEAKYEEARSKRHAIANEAQALGMKCAMLEVEKREAGLQIFRLNTEVSGMEQKIAVLEKELYTLRSQAKA